MAVPPAIKAFLVFSAALSLLMLTTLVPGLKWLVEAATPFTGWGGNMPFFFAIGSWPGLFKGAAYPLDAITLRRYLTGACVTMTIAVVFGIVDWWMFHTLQSESNPWLRYHPLRPLWTIVLPLAWAVVLMTERMRISPQSAH